MRRGSGGGIVGLIVVVWLIIGIIASVQRGYFKQDNENCGDFATIAVTIIAGPLNYAGVNPKVADCNVPEMPQPSQ